MAEVKIINNSFISVSDALKLVSQFFDKEWSDTEEEDVRLAKMTDGYSTALHAIYRTTPVVHEPACLLLRERKGFSSTKSFVFVVAQKEQVIVYYENHYFRRG